MDFAVALGVLAISRIGPPGWQVFISVIATITVSIAIALAGALWRWKSVRVVARELTRGHAQRIASSPHLTCLKAKRACSPATAARRETSTFAARLRVGDYLRPKLPWRKALWLLLPLAALALVEGLKQWRAGQLAPELAVLANCWNKHDRSRSARKQSIKSFIKSPRS